MVNYLGIGADASIGIGFDLRRTKSQLGNKCVYCWEGFKKLIYSAPKVKKLVTSLQLIELNSGFGLQNETSNTENTVLPAENIGFQNEIINIPNENVG